MIKRKKWESGMRLSDKHLRDSDEAHYGWISQAVTMASAGRFGLVPNRIPFDVNLTVDKECVYINKLNCFAVTPSYDLVEIEFDTKYSSPLKCGKSLPHAGMTDDLHLVVMTTEKWKDTNDGFEELDYEFDVIKANSKMPENAFPIARFIYENNCWHQDVEYVPPCLFVSSHEKYKNLLERFLGILKQIEEKTQPLPENSDALTVMSVLLPFVQQIRIDTDWNRDTLTPTAFLANIQKITGTFYTVSILTDSYDSNKPGDFKGYARYSYDNSLDIFQLVSKGIDLCEELMHRIEKSLNSIKVVPIDHSSKIVIQPPFIAEEHLIQSCNSSRISIPVCNVQQGATVFYSTDGNAPTMMLDSSNTILLETGYDPKKRMPDKTVFVNLMAIIGQNQSPVATYSITLHYEYKAWSGYTI